MNAEPPFRRGAPRAAGRDRRGGAAPADAAAAPPPRRGGRHRGRRPPAVRGAAPQAYNGAVATQLSPYLAQQQQSAPPPATTTITTTALFAAASCDNTTSANVRQQNNARATSAFDAEDVDTWQTKDFHRLIKTFAEDTASTSMTLPARLTPAQRSVVHRLAAAFRLDHKSTGAGSQRALTLSKVVSHRAGGEGPAVTVRNGVRVKTFSGYQGAQMLPCDFLSAATADALRAALEPFKAAMYRGIHTEASRPSKSYHVAQPGLSAVPGGAAVSAARYAQLQRFRHSLPAFTHRDAIVAAVRENDVVIISGATGCGKTTQVPQLLYDAGLFPATQSIICTQPRRISALSVAHRVAEERGEACGRSCGYIIRFENVTSRETRIVYETTGILLRRLHTDHDLRDISCIVVDEVHERDVETDFALLLLRDRLLAQRRNNSHNTVGAAGGSRIKLVVMSATVQIEALVHYFACCTDTAVPVISIAGTLFPVREYFLEDALAMTGVQPSAVPAMALANAPPPAAPPALPEPHPTAVHATDATTKEEGQESLYDRMRSAAFSNVGERDPEAMVPYEVIVRLIVHIHTTDRDLAGSVLVFLPGWSAIQGVLQRLRRTPAARELSIFTLHSSLTSAEQQRVFEPAPRRYRKVILATNIAETSITIDDVVYVVDSCLYKSNAYDLMSNTSALRATFIGKANGMQRRGRAGRCRAGVCFHLLPAATYAALPDFVPPAILRTSLEEICLQVKAIEPAQSCLAVLSRALDPPPASSVAHAVTFLTEMGAFTAPEEHLTNLGRALAQLPIHPQLGKMLFTAACFGVLEPVSLIAAGLSLKSVFVKPQPFQRSAAQDSLRHLDAQSLSDHLCVVKVYDGWLRSGRSGQYASEHFADPVALRSLERTKKQLAALVLRSPLVRRMPDAAWRTSRFQHNTGLVRLVLLWSLYPRIATLEYRYNRNMNTPQVICWDDKYAAFAASSVLDLYKKRDIGDRSFVMYYDRMYIEAVLNLFDSSCMTPVDVALCVRELTVLPLTAVPAVLLDDHESKLVPARRLRVDDDLTDRDALAAMFFDGDKKLFLADRRVAATLKVARDCMDYYLALCVKRLRADLFPAKMIEIIASLIGYPLSAEDMRPPPAQLSRGQGAAAAPVGAGAGYANEYAPQPQLHADAMEPTANLPAFVRGSGRRSAAPAVSSEDDDAEKDDEEAAGVELDLDADALHLTAAEEQRVRDALGDLAVLRTSVPAVLRPRTSDGDDDVGGGDAHGAEEEEAKKGEERDEEDEGEEDDEEDDEDIVVANAGDLVAT